MSLIVCEEYRILLPQEGGKELTAWLYYFATILIVLRLLAIAILHKLNCQVQFMAV